MSHHEAISKHSKGVVRIAQTWENCNVGTTARCAYRRALPEAEALAARINADLAEAMKEGTP